jgi:hypothetical protein
LTGAGQTLGTNAIAKNLRGLRDAHDRGFLKKENLAGPAAEPNTSVLTHFPLRMAGGNELGDGFHHQRFHRISTRRDCNASGVGTIEAPAALFVVG